MARSRRPFPRVLLSLAIVALALAGCVRSAGPAAPTNAAREAAASPAVEVSPTATRATTAALSAAATLRLAATSGEEAFARVLADVFAARIAGLKVELVKSDGQLNNLRLLGSGRAEFALVRDDLAVLAAAKEPPFADAAITVASLAALHAEVVQMFANADGNVASSRDLVGRKVNLPPDQSAEALLTDAVLREGAFRARDFASIARLSGEQAAEALREGRVDALITAGPAPIPAVQRAAEQRPVRLLPLTAQWQEAVQKKYPALRPVVLPGGLYRGQDAPVETVGVRVILAAVRDLPEETAYALALALVEGIDDIRARHPLGSQIVLEEIARSVRTPFHAAAVQYYRERGLAK